MARLTPQLELNRCPHCNVDTPQLTEVGRHETRDHAGAGLRQWCIYNCARCGGLVTASAPGWNQEVLQVFPSPLKVEDDLPERAKAYLTQAIASLHAPAGAVMLAASAVDAMLKDKKYVDGSLYARIEKAAEDHLITNDMAKWAHEVRLDANDQRHADEAASLPSESDAKRCIDFANALAMFLFVMPARVRRGLKAQDAAVGS